MYLPIQVNLPLFERPRYKKRLLRAAFFLRDVNLSSNTYMQNKYSGFKGII